MLTDALCDVQVTDGKTTVTTILEVFVEDENDNAPEFLQQSYQVMMAEQTPAMQSVLTITATDADDGNNAVITYSLVAASLPSFFIDPANGQHRPCFSRPHFSRSLSFFLSVSLVQRSLCLSLITSHFLVARSTQRQPPSHTHTTTSPPHAGDGGGERD